MGHRVGISSKELKRSLLINGLFFTCHCLYEAFPLFHPFFLILALIGNAIAWGLTSALQALLYVVQWRLLKGRLHPALRYASYALPTVGLFIILSFWVIPKTQKPNQVQPLKSPSGKYTLRMPKTGAFLGDYRWQLKIYGPWRRLEYADDSDFSGILSVYWVWDNEDRVWLYNSDDGYVYYWAKENGQWRRHLYEGSNGREVLADIRPPRALFPDYALKFVDEESFRLQPLKSPSSRYTLQVPEENGRCMPAIYNGQGELEYKEQGTDLGPRSFYWSWDHADRVWFCSVSDGAYYLEKRDGRWERRAWRKDASTTASQCAPPEALITHIRKMEDEIRRLVNRGEGDN